jgi:EAL domain-containing protein (putative c-di-GMP-specific phosphodiesterase class I)
LRQIRGASGRRRSSLVSANADGRLEGDMNIHQRTVRYGFGLHFTAGVTSVVLMLAAFFNGMPPQIEYALGASLIVVLFLHARMGFALNRAQREIEMLKRLTDRVSGSDSAGMKKIATALNLSPSATLSAVDRQALSKVREAIEADRVDFYLQPIVSLPQRKARYFEAFSRLRDSTGKVLRPNEYIEAAERANKIGVIDNMILIRCVQALRQHSRRTPRLTVFCNLSPATIYDTEFFNHFTDYLEANADLASNLVFEFTYPAVQTMHPKVTENLAAIAAKGFAFSVDHVHSIDLDWEDLRKRNFSFAKAPATLLLAAGRGDEASLAKLSNFRKRLSELGIDLIAEKIELEANMPEILSLGIDFGQGNLFGPARSAEFYLGEYAEETKSIAA